jgi:hypothetical protein
MSLDLSTPTVLRNRERGGEKTPLDPLLTARQSRVVPLSPTLPPMVFVGYAVSKKVLKKYTNTNIDFI